MINHINNLGSIHTWSATTNVWKMNKLLIKNNAKQAPRIEIRPTQKPYGKLRSYISDIGTHYDKTFKGSIVCEMQNTCRASVMRKIGSNIPQIASSDNAYIRRTLYTLPTTA